jgi:hypothetical protein
MLEKREHVRRIISDTKYEGEKIKIIIVLVNLNSREAKSFRIGEREMM